MVSEVSIYGQRLFVLGTPVRENVMNVGAFRGGRCAQQDGQESEKRGIRGKM